MSVNWFLFSAYVVIFAIIFFFLVFLNSKQKKLGEELRTLAEGQDYVED